MTSGDGIRWPGRYHPAHCPIHVSNELAIAAPIETVWAWLVRAPLWPSWYPNAAGVHFLAGEPPDLALDTRFRWKTFGVRMYRFHQIWLERLAEQARSGMPPAATPPGSPARSGR
jgi:hypothetical protein